MRLTGELAGLASQFNARLISPYAVKPGSCVNTSRNNARTLTRTEGYSEVIDPNVTTL
jgi:hypothetical protein